MSIIWNRLLNYFIFNFTICMTLEKSWSWWFVLKISHKTSLMNVTHIKLCEIFFLSTHLYYGLALSVLPIFRNAFFQCRKFRIGVILFLEWLVWHPLFGNGSSQRTAITVSAVRSPRKRHWLQRCSCGDHVHPICVHTASLWPSRKPHCTVTALLMWTYAAHSDRRGNAELWRAPCACKKNARRDMAS